MSVANLILNPGFEADVSGWFTNPGAIWRHRTSADGEGDPKFGRGFAALEIVDDTNNPNSGTSDTDNLSGPTAGRTFTFSGYFRGYGSTIGKQIMLGLYEGGGAAGEVGNASSVAVTLTADWKRVTVTGTLVHDDDTYVRWYILPQTYANGDLFHVDGAQIEEGTEATPYPQANLGLTFQIAFGSQPGDDPFVWTTVPGSMAVTYQRGAPNEYGRMETGESEVEVGDAASALDPNNTGSAYYPNVRRGKAMRVFVTVEGVDYPLFQHFIERLPRRLSVGSVWTQRTVTGIDAFGGFALAGLKAVAYASELSGTRWNNVLNSIGWPAGRRDIDAGSSTLDPYTNDADSDMKALQHLLDVVGSENGIGFMDAAGDARFIERHAFITDTAIAATFADGRSLETGDYPGALPYTDLQPESTDIVNEYTGKREGGTVLTASDATSIDDYGPRSQELTLLVSTDNEVQDALDWRLSQTKDPYERVDAITVKPGDDMARWATVLGLEIGDRILVVEWPPGFAAPVETQYLIRHLAGTLPTALAASEFTFQLTPVAVDAWFVLDDATAGRLDSNKLVY